jgi:hypothetical protein
MNTERSTRNRERDAVRNSGLPVYQAGPGLNDGPTLPATADRKSEAHGPVQPKPGREFEGGALEGVQGDASPPVSSSLVKQEINRNNPRGKHCGRFTVAGTDPKVSRTHFRRVYCKCWDCSYCGPRRARRAKLSIQRHAEKHRLSRFITLTVDPSKLHGAAPVPYINECFGKFRIYLKRKYGIAPTYIRVLEFHKSGLPHFHILIDRYIPQAWISSAWSAVGGGRMVDVRQRDIHRISHYLSKYLTKELLLSAPKRSRRITTSRTIKLFEKAAKEFAWAFLKAPISRLFDIYQSVICGIERDEENELSAFSISATA